MDINRLELDNGLRVLHHYDPTTVMAAVNVLYNVGARDESPELTGMAHLFEHLMFGGSVNISDFDGEIERAGGMNNAWTSNDFTNFYDIAPAQNIETLFWLESDRMLELAFTPKSLEVQRHVVIEEFKQVCLNQPYGDFAHRLRSLLYKTHPYRYPTIGKEPEHIARVTLDDVKRFFFSHYAPNNAVIAVDGNVSFERVAELARKWFGTIPRREIAPREYLREEPIRSPRYGEMTGRVPQTLVVRAFPMPGYGEKGYVECDLITDILASGRASRFYRNLVTDGTLFSEADASIAGSEEPGYLMLTGKLLGNGAEAEREAIDRMTAEAMRLCAEAPDQHELTRAVNRFESNRTFAGMSFLNRAFEMALAEMHGEVSPDAVQEKYRAVTPESIKATAEEVINPDHSVTLVYRPEQDATDCGCVNL